jgi:hypothetical protein
MTAEAAPSMDMKFPYNVPTTDYIVDVMTEKNAEEGIAVIAKSWFEMEPQVAYVKQTYQLIYDSLYEMQLKEFKEGRYLSLVLIHKSGKIVGASVNRELKIDEVIEPKNEVDAIVEELHDKYKMYFKENKKEGKIVEGAAVGVLDEVKGTGIVVILAIATQIQGHKLGYAWATTSVTSVYGCAACEHLSLTKVHTMDQEEFVYKDKSGVAKKPFAGMDAWYTALLNEKRPKHKQLETSAKYFTLFESPTTQGYENLKMLIS